MKFADYLTDPVEKKLIEALTDRMLREPIDRISVSDIMKDAGVSRSTFYRHYRDKYDLLNQSYQKILDQTVFTVYEGGSFKKEFYRLYMVLSSYPVIFKNALESKDYNSLRNYIYDKMVQLYIKMMENAGMDMSKRYNQLLLAGYITGSLEITCQWASGGMKESIEDLFKLSYQLMPEEIRTCVSIYYM